MTHPNPPHVMLAFGTRPEAIKMLPVALELKQRSGIRTTVLVTGQHRAMLDQVFQMFGMRPDIDLELMSHNQTLAQVTSRVLNAMSDVLAEYRPDLVLVHGDTTTAMAAALAAFYARVPIGHVEAGLRSYDLARPWPEEFNRVAVDCIADLLFAPTTTSAENLAKEYNRNGRVLVTGNTGIDALFHVARLVEKGGALREDLERRYKHLDRTKHLILVTGHRRESFGGGFEGICEGLKAVAARGDVEILYPVHLNPNVQGVVRKMLEGSSSIHLVDPVDYGDMVYLMRRATILLTDSGGIQEEGPSLGKPVLVMRDVTERPEALATGLVKLVGTDPRVIRSAVDDLLANPARLAKLEPQFPYGDGQASRRIADCIEHSWTRV